MNILFLFISLPNLEESGAFSDLIKEFANQGHNVKVATPSNKSGEYGIVKESGIDVLRFKTDQLTRNTSNIKKGIAYIKYTFQCLSAINREFNNEKFDLIISHSLPPEIYFVISRLKKKYNAKFYLMLCEYIWQDSVSLGFFKKSSLICKYYQFLERNLIKIADYIGSPSQGNIDFAINLYPWVKSKNIDILHYSESPIILSKEKLDIKSKYGLDDKFVVIYGGNMSIAQKIDNVIYLAESCKDYKEIVFLLLGKGQEINRIKNLVEEKQLMNIVFIDFMPKKEYIELLRNCDLGIVSLNEKLAIPNIPSKTITYFNLSIPIIASIDKVTDYGKYIENAGAGLWSYAGDNDKFKENLLTIYQNPELKKKMGENAYEFYNKYMTPNVAYNTITNQINNK